MRFGSSKTQMKGNSAQNPSAFFVSWESNAERPVLMLMVFMVFCGEVERSLAMGSTGISRRPYNKNNTYKFFF